MTDNFEEYKYYPTEDEVNEWLEDIWETAQNARLEVEELGSGMDSRLSVAYLKNMGYVYFKPKGREPFYGYWQPCNFSGPAPLLVHTPGAGAEIIMHPDLVMQGYSVLHINPLGYMTPSGVNTSIELINGNAPVFYDTLYSCGKKGYKEWLTDCAIAIMWAQKQQKVISDRLSFFGTSQGGMGTMLLGSLFKDRGVRCIAADVPFATNFPFIKGNNLSPTHKTLLFDTIDKMDQPEEGWRALGFIDWLSHAKRLNIPVMVTGGGNDDVCPYKAIQSVFDKLPSTKLYYHLDRQNHDFTNQFLTMLSSWFRIYA